MATVEQDTRIAAPNAGGELPSDSELIERWSVWMDRTKNLSPNTIKLYRRTVELFSRDIPEFLYASEEQIQAWLEAKGGQAGTFNNRVSGLASFYRWARKQKLILANPCDELDRPKQHKRMPKPVEDLEAALVAADAADIRANERGSVPRRVGETRDMMILLAYTGFRIHEAVKCDWPTPCPEEAFVIGKGSKEELMLLPEKAREAWNRLGGKWPLTARATQRRFEKIRTKQHPDGIHPHMLRHWRATSLVRAGVEIGTVSKIMRHSSVQTTMGYSAYAKDQFRDALGKVD